MNKKWELIGLAFAVELGITSIRFSSLATEDSGVGSRNRRSPSCGYYQQSELSPCVGEIA